MAAPSMNKLADDYADRGMGSIFLYTQEAHPGENYPPLTSMEQKFANAADLRDKLGVTRQIYADAFEGDCHWGYGSMPNMTWIFNAKGVPLYKSDWSDAASAENAVAYFLDVETRRKSGEVLVPFNVERLDYRNNDTRAFFEGLALAGPKAVEEFKKAFG
jgi:hypothetical protein